MTRRDDVTGLSLIGEKLREMREKRGWTQGDLSRRMRTNSDSNNESLFSVRHISRVESGKKGVGVGFLDCMANALGTTLRELSEEPEQKLRRFHSILEEEFKIFSERPPDTSEEAKFRRQTVKKRIEALSMKIFNQKTPVELGINLPNIEYPSMECKWCWEVREPEKGSEGNCPHCKLPLCHWVGTVGRHRRNEEEVALRKAWVIDREYTKTQERHPTSQPRETSQLGVRIDRASQESFRKACRNLGFSQRDVLEALICNFLNNLSEKGQMKLVEREIGERD